MAKRDKILGSLNLLTSMGKTISHLQIFGLGRNPEISAAEIRARFPRASIISVTKNFLLAENLSDDLSLKKLGGTPFLARVFAVTPKLDLNKINDFFAKKFQAKTGKQNFGVISLGFPRKPNSQILLTVKKFLRSQQISSRFVNKNFQNLSTPEIEFEILRRQGCALLIAQTAAQIFSAEIWAVQPFTAIAARDYGKPARATRNGMLPPKLAQILLNLTLGDLTAQTVYDPFCGTGTILVEAGLLGHRLLGSDLNPQMLLFTQRNLAAQRLKAQLWRQDATQPIPRPVAYVITEGSLGPPLTQTPTPQSQAKIFSNLTKLYRKFFQNLKAQKVGITFPFFGSGKNPAQRFTLQILPPLKKLGWQNTLKQELLYKRPQQIVGREIVVLKKNNRKQQ